MKLLVRLDQAKQGVNPVPSALEAAATRALRRELHVRLLVACLTPQQHASLSQGRICSDNSTCYHTEVEVADQTFYLTQSQHMTPGRPVPALAPGIIG